MSYVHIQTGATEPIVFVALDAAGSLLTGKTDIKIRIRRSSDNYYFDWSDNTFKAPVSVTVRHQALEEISSTYAPGEYQLNKIGHAGGFNTNSITNPTADDMYFILSVQDPGIDVMNIPQFGVIKVGGYLDTITDNEPVIF